MSSRCPRCPLAPGAHAKIRAMSTRILVVDDDASLAEMIGIMLESESYTPTLCHDGAKALDAFHEVNPDLVLLDLMLPGLDGVEICRLIRSESDVPIIMLTARTDTQDVVAGLEAGADDYVTKPFKSKELLAASRPVCAVPTPGRPSTCAPVTSTSTSPVTRSSAATRSSP